MSLEEQKPAHLGEETDPVLLIQRLGRACRGGFLAVTALFAYIAIRLAWSIPSFAAIYKDMLNGKTLPVVTTGIIAAQPLILLLTIALPVVAVICAFRIRRPDHAVIAISLCTLFLFLLSMLLWTGLTEPLNTIITELTTNE